MGQRLSHKPWFCIVGGMLLIGGSLYIHFTGDYPFKPVTPLGIGILLCMIGIHRLWTGRPLLESFESDLKNPSKRVRKSDVPDAGPPDSN